MVTQSVTPTTGSTGQPAVAPGQFTYSGTWPGFFGEMFVQGLLCVITLGIYYPWAFCHIRKWILEHTHAEGRQLTYVGRGGQLFGILIVQLLLTIITLGIWSLLQLPTHKVLSFDVKNTKFAS